MSSPKWEIINGVRYNVDEEQHIQPRTYMPYPKKSKLKPLTLEEVRKWTEVPTYIPVIKSSGIITFIPK